MGWPLSLVDCYKINTASVLRNSPTYPLHKDVPQMFRMIPPPPPPEQETALEIRAQGDPVLEFMVT